MFVVSCISFDSYIKPQRIDKFSPIQIVVYLLIPTSNHNHQRLTVRAMKLYIFWFLHQTTTSAKICSSGYCCISFDSYIKPQRVQVCSLGDVVVYLLIPTSNHSCRWLSWKWPPVVYLLIPTSNHNDKPCCSGATPLYIFWFLHQTTTFACSVHVTICCISFDSYIKPQLRLWLIVLMRVVYLLIPTSNHNFLEIPKKCSSVVYLLIPTSNHNVPSVWCRPVSLYIFWFLHQTTTGLN